MSNVGARVRSAAMGMALAVAMLLLGQLAESVRDEAARLFSGTYLRWALLIHLVLGAVLAYTAMMARRDWLIPTAAGAVLLVPLLGMLGLPAPGGLLSLYPPVGAFPLAVAVGVLAFGAATAGRAR
jgi:hypothetical protein